MAKALVKTRKIGGSIMARIPKEVAEQEGIGEGELVEIEVRKARRDWFGTMKGLKPFSRDEELDANEIRR
jgi:antitoxin component of MazEF toxin-antitoxin module